MDALALLRQHARNLAVDAAVVADAAAEETQNGAKTDVNGNANGKLKDEKTVVADVSAIAAYAEAFVVYSAATVTADN